MAIATAIAGFTIYDLHSSTVKNISPVSLLSISLTGVFSNLTHLFSFEIFATIQLYKIYIEMCVLSDHHLSSML